MKKLLLSLGFMAAAAICSSAVETSWSVTFANGASNNETAWNTSSAMTAVCSEGAANLSGLTAASSASPGMYGLKIGTNKGTGSATFGIAADSQVTPTKVEIEVSANKNPAKMAFKFNDTAMDALATSNTNGSYKTYTLTNPGELTSLKFEKATSTGEGFLFIHKITVYYNEGDAPTVSAPAIEMVEGDYSFSVAMTCDTEGAEIRYTTDGTTPTAGSTLYSAPVEVWEATTFKAVAIKDGELSNVSTFTANPPYILDGFDAMLGMEDVPEAGIDVIVKAPMTAVFHNGQNLYAKCGHSYMLIFGNIGTTLSNGDTFNRLAGTFKLYNGQPEVINPEIGTVTAGTPVTPAEATLDMLTQAMMCQYVTVENVNIALGSNANTFTLSDADGNTLTMYNKFGLTGIEAGTGCTVTGFVGIFGTTLQLLPTEVTEGTETLAAPEFNPASGSSVSYQSYVELTAEEGAEIFFKYDTDQFELYNADDKILIFTPAGQTATIEAYAKKGELQSETVTATYTVTKKNPNVRWLNAEGGIVESVDYVLGSTDPFELPMFDCMSDGEPTLTSSDPEVASINEYYGVDIHKAGTTVITVTVPETASFAGGEASFTLNVLTQQQATDITTTVVFADQTWIEYSAASKSQTWVSSDNFEFPTTISSTGTYAKVYSNDLRIYGSGNNKITVSAPEGYEFKAAVFTVDTANSDGNTPTVDDNATTKVTPQAVAPRATAKYEDFGYTFTTPKTTYVLSTSTASKNMRVSKVTMTIGLIQSGIDNIATDNTDAPVEYYNLQGVRVLNPSAGIYIRRQGTEVTKVMIR